jgi:hypothetical protein
MTEPTSNKQITILSGNDDSDIHSLNSLIGTLAQEEKSWHDRGLWLIGAAVIVSLVVFLAQHTETGFTRKRADAESKLSVIKDRKVSLEISSADERAGKANERAAALEAESGKSRVAIASAQADAARATERAALAESHLAESNAQAKLAEQHAKEADVKAEGFRLDIARANESAEKARAQVSEATAEAARANLELAKLRTPRSLMDAAGLAASLKKFKGTEYTFSSVFQDPEAIDLLVAIDSMLKLAEWTKVKPPPGFPALNVYGKEDGNAVPVGFGIGVSIQFNSPDSLTLPSLPFEKLPTTALGVCRNETGNPER